MKAKSDKNQLATKNDVKQTEKVLRQEMSRTEKVLRQEILRVEETVESLEDKVDTKFDKVMTSLDGIVKTLDDLKTENVVGANQIGELIARGEDHEKRIARLESPTTQ